MKYFDANTNGVFIFVKKMAKLNKDVRIFYDFDSIVVDTSNNNIESLEDLLIPGEYEFNYAMDSDKTIAYIGIYHDLMYDRYESIGILSVDDCEKNKDKYRKYKSVMVSKTEKKPVNRVFNKAKMDLKYLFTKSSSYKAEKPAVKKDEKKEKLLKEKEVLCKYRKLISDDAFDSCKLNDLRHNVSLDRKYLTEEEKDTFGSMKKKDLIKLADKIEDRKFEEKVNKKLGL